MAYAQTPSADNNWLRPPTTQQLRVAGLLINADPRNFEANKTPSSPQNSNGLTDLYAMRSKPSSWEMAQGQAAYDKRAAFDANESRAAWRADSPQLMHSWDEAKVRSAPTFSSVPSSTPPVAPVASTAPTFEESKPPLASSFSQNTGANPSPASSPIFDGFNERRVFASPVDLDAPRREPPRPAPVTFDPFKRPPSPTFGDQIDSSVKKWGQAPDPNPLAGFEAATTPEKMQAWRRDVMATPQGRAMFEAAKGKQSFDLAQGQMEAQKANNSNWEKEQTREATNQRAAATITAGNERAARNLQAIKERAQTSLDRKDLDKKNAADIDYVDSVSRLKARWDAGLLSPQDMIRFEGLQTSKAIEAELKNIEDARKGKGEPEATAAPKQEKPPFTPLQSVEIRGKLRSIIDDPKQYGALGPERQDQIWDEYKWHSKNANPTTSGEGVQQPQAVDAAPLTREAISALPSGTPIKMPDGSIKYKK